MRSRFDVLLHTGLIIFPLIAFTARLIGLVYTNTWDRSSTRIDDLPLGSGYFSNTLYVNYSATSLILVASWSSSVVVPLIGSLLMFGVLRGGRPYDLDVGELVPESLADACSVRRFD